MVLICISLIMSDAEYIFMHLLVICISSWVKCLFKFFTHFSTEFFCLLIDESILHILDTTPFAYIFSHSVAEVFNFDELSIFHLWIVLWCHI